uniref:Uncharacterized protein n=1 Tax=Brassica oleracea TaxID=3712 RepID=A0A3P6AAD1_BRAOL|nr:unnamed protein product [Brassica oleracea]
MRVGVYEEQWVDQRYQRSFNNDAPLDLDCNLILDLKLTVTIPVGVGGSSFSDLILTDFLDKFMEKKPKQNTWHSGSQIEPSKKDDYLNGVLDFTRTSGDCELKTADSFHCSPLHL